MEHHNDSLFIDLGHNSSYWIHYHCTLELSVLGQQLTSFFLYLFIFVFGLIGNTLVIWVNWKWRNTDNVVTFCVLNIGLADLGLVLTLPFWMVEVIFDSIWVFGRTLCKLIHLIFLVNMYGSIFIVAYMTVERYVAFVRPSVVGSRQERLRRLVVCITLWFFALFLTLLENVHVDLYEFAGPGCLPIPLYSEIEWYISISFLSIIFGFVVPAAIIITFNFLIARKVKASYGRDGRRTCWIVHVYSLVFIACWFPRQLVLLLITLDDLMLGLYSCNAISLLYYSFHILDCFSLLHCVANPIFYNFLSKGFRSSLASAVVHYLPKQAAKREGNGSSGSSRSHSVVIS
ncbi:G-protein coupled receptor 182 isoform X2 [Polypterus senegalus]